MEKEPDETTSVLDMETLAPYKEKIKTLEKELAALDNFLKSHFDTETKPQRFDFVEVFKNLNTVAPPNIDSVAAALSGDLLERNLVYMANRLRHPPLVMGEILTRLQHVGKDETSEQVFEYIKTLHLGIIENKKRVLWQLAEYIGTKKSAAIFEEQDLIKARAFPEYLISKREDPVTKEEEKRWLESSDPEAVEIVKSEFNLWYEKNKERFLKNREKIHGEVADITSKLDEKTAYKVIEKHLSTNPKEIFELMESQARISSG